MALCTLLRQDTTNLAKYWIRGAESPRENQVTGFIQVFYIYVGNSSHCHIRKIEKRK